MKEVFNLDTRKGPDPVVNSDMTAELQSLSTQLYYMHMMMLIDQAQDRRKLLWEYESGVGIRNGAMLQSHLK